MASTTAQQNTQAHLLRLPPELRNKIYEYALIPNAGHRVFIQRTAFYARPAAPPILQVCCTIRHEAMPIYYANNTFRVARPYGTYYALGDWLAALPAAARTAIRRIELDHRWYCKKAMRRRREYLMEILAHHGVFVDPRVLNFDRV